MGSITDAGLLDEVTLAGVVRTIVEPTLRGADDEGFPFRGVLFIGLMLTAEGPRVLEYNVRFGDPETQAVLMRLTCDLTEVFQAITDRRLGEVEINWSNDSSVCVVLAARGYPLKPEVGSRIEGLEDLGETEDVAVFHAATSRGPNGEWLTAGGRVLGVTATGPTLELARARCYGAVGRIRWAGMHYRRDIGGPAGQAQGRPR